MPETTIANKASKFKWCSVITILFYLCLFSVVISNIRNSSWFFLLFDVAFILYFPCVLECIFQAFYVAYFPIIITNVSEIVVHQFRCLRIYLMESTCNSCLSITWTVSKILLIFHTLAVLSIEEVTILFQFPIVRGSSWIILPKWASRTLTSFFVCILHT